MERFEVGGVDAIGSDEDRARAQYAFLRKHLDEYPDLQALLHALKTFAPQL